MLKYKEALSAPAPRATDSHAPTGALTSRAATDGVNGHSPGGVGVLPGRAARRPGGPASGGGLPFGPESLCAHEGLLARRAAGSEGVRGGSPRPRGPLEAPGDSGPLLDKGHSISSSRALKPLSFHEVYSDGCIKINPRTGEIVEAVLASRPIFKVDKYAEPRERIERASPQEGEAGAGHGEDRAAARARRKVFELADCNPFDLFFTLTLSPEKIDRYDYKGAVEKLRVYLSNRVQRHGLFYVAVPEFHSDGAIHFHGLCNSSAVGLTDSGRRWKGRTVYNMDWKIGFSTAVKLEGDYSAVCKYICKYVTKAAAGGTIGGRYYFHGGALKTYHCKYFKGAGAPLTGRAFRVEDAHLVLLYVDLERPENMRNLEDLLK